MNSMNEKTIEEVEDWSVLQGMVVQIFYSEPKPNYKEPEALYFLTASGKIYILKNKQRRPQ